MSRIITYKGFKLQVVRVISRCQSREIGVYVDGLRLREFEVSYKMLTSLPDASDEYLYSITKMLFEYKHGRISIVSCIHHQRRACYKFLDELLAGMSLTDQLNLGVGEFAPPVVLKTP